LRDLLKNLSFAGSDLSGDIGVATGDDAARLRQLLEKLELQLQEAGADHLPRNRGLGSNNILFMACELLLLGSEEDGFPFLLIEEPEAQSSFTWPSPLPESRAPPTSLYA
jgi:putative ATP-dependent endonuclease of OLD family